MELQVRNVTWKSRKVKEIYLASFPKKERMPFWTMLLLSKMDSTKFWEFSDGETVCGFAYVAAVQNIVFIMFLAVDPACRRQHIGERLVSSMLAQMDEGKDVAVTTYREGDPRGAAARAFYRSVGFSEGKLGEEFGCPVQEFTLKGKPAGQR